MSGKSLNARELVPKHEAHEVSMKVYCKTCYKLGSVALPYGPTRGNKCEHCGSVDTINMFATCCVEEVHNIYKREKPEPTKEEKEAINTRLAAMEHAYWSEHAEVMLKALHGSLKELHGESPPVDLEALECVKNWRRRIDAKFDALEPGEKMVFANDMLNKYIYYSMAILNE